MDVSEVREAKLALEQHILRLIDIFQKKTGLDVEKVYVCRFEERHKSVGLQDHVNVVLEEL